MTKMKELLFITVLTAGSMEPAAFAQQDTSHTVKHYTEVKSDFSDLLDEHVVLSISPLKEGSWGDGIYKVNTPGRSFVLRYMNKERNKEDLIRESKMCSLMGRNSVSPKVYATSIPSRIIIMDEVVGEKLLSPKLSVEQLKILGQLLRSIQSVPNPVFLESVSPNTILQAFVKTFNITLSDELKAAQESLMNDFLLLGSTDSSNSYKLSHLDLNPGNILSEFSGDIKIIDWEDGIITHPYLDLATIFIFYNLGKQEVNAFFQEYTNGKPSAIDLQQLTAAYKFMNFLYAVRLFSISTILPDKPSKESSFDQSTLQQLFSEKKWDEILSRIDNKNTALSLSSLYLDQALNTSNYPWE